MEHRRVHQRPRDDLEHRGHARSGGPLRRSDPQLKAARAAATWCASSDLGGASTATSPARTWWATTRHTPWDDRDAVAFLHGAQPELRAVPGDAAGRDARDRGPRVQPLAAVRLRRAHRPHQRRRRRGSRAGPPGWRTRSSTGSNDNYNYIWTNLAGPAEADAAVRPVVPLPLLGGLPRHDRAVRRFRPRPRRPAHHSASSGSSSARTPPRTARRLQPARSKSVGSTAGLRPTTTPASPCGSTMPCGGTTPEPYCLEEGPHTVGRRRQSATDSRGRQAGAANHRHARERLRYPVDRTAAHWQLRHHAST